MKSLSIIVPCYNYEKKIINKIYKLKKKIEKFNIKYEILIIDDCSSDDTFFSLKKKFINKKNIVLLKNSYNRGKSYSVRRGLEISKYNHVLLIDCDLAYFEKINEIINKLKKRYDFVSVNRKLKKSKLVSRNLSLYQYLRHFLGQLVSNIIKFSLKLNIDACDTQAGLKGLKKTTFIKKNKFISNRFFLDLELTYLFIKNKKKIYFVPVKYNISKNSSIKIFDLKNFSIVYELTKVIYKYKRFK